MRNQSVNLFQAADGRGELGGGPWRVDRRPGQRLFWVFALLLIPVGAIGFRLVYLQAYLAVGFVDVTDRTTVAFEAIPARDGRILAADGRILARDVVQYDVHAHYRWLESPPHPSWLSRRT
ncbi:MAG: hypothetical protein IID45_11580, partial [Planctomycetes bacterium]|nr:hypothetical protein [Planctomycetota bacterium]